MAGKDNGRGEFSSVAISTPETVRENAGGSIVPQNGNAVTQVEQTRAIAEVQAAMYLARMYPRDTLQAIDRIMNECQRPGLAEVGVYDYPRGGVRVTGASIRLAEVLARNWGNVQFGIRELDQRNGESTVVAFAWDMETNTRSEVTFQVPHIRYSKEKGNMRLTDPRDIYEMVANQGARRMRACVLRIIPGDVVDMAVDELSRTLKATADTSEAAMKKMLERFAEFGVTKEQIEKRIGSKLSAITPAQVVSLRNIYNSLNDGMSKPGEWFDMKSVATPENKSEEPPSKFVMLCKLLAEEFPDDPEAWNSFVLKNAGIKGVKDLNGMKDRLDDEYAEIFAAIGKRQRVADGQTLPLDK